MKSPKDEEVQFGESLVSDSSGTSSSNDDDDQSVGDESTNL